MTTYPWFETARISLPPALPIVGGKAYKSDEMYLAFLLYC
jgi:hypothetical protein